MSFPLRLLACAIIVTLALHLPSLSQTPPCADPGSLVLDEFTGTLALGLTQDMQSFSGSGTTGHLIWNVTTLRTPAGGIDYSIIVPSITVTGNGSDIDAMTTDEVFGHIALATVRKGIALGLTPCGDTCTIVRVRQPACVIRTGSDSTTQFTPCPDAGCCTRTFSICCPPGIEPIITLLSSNSPGCSPTASPECESTCGQPAESLSHIEVTPENRTP